MSQQICNKGSSCQFLKSGTCKFSHKGDPKASPVKKQTKAVASKDEKIKKRLNEKPLVRNRHVVRQAAGVMKMIADVRQKSAIIADYVNVAKCPDAKVPVVDPKDSQTVSLFRTAARAAIGGHHIRTNLFYNTIVTSGAGAAIAGFFGVNPSAAGEYASYAALYDECRCTAVTSRYLGCSINSTGATVTTAAYAVAFDPDYGVNPAGVNDLMDSEHVNMHFMGVQLGTFTNSASVCPVDLHKLHATIRPSTVLNIDMKTAENFPGAWMECNDASGSPATFTNGYMRYYVTTTGGTSAVQLQMYTQMHMEFRIRQ